MFITKETANLMEKEGLILNFAHEKFNDEEIFSLFGHLDNITRFNDSWTMAHIVHSAGIFSSVSEAKKAGWNNKISEGWNLCWDKKFIRNGFDFLSGAAIIGKNSKRRAIWVLN